MKKILLIPLVFLWISFTANAQITVNLASYTASNISQYVDTLPLVSIGPGIAGANQTYDFSALHSHLPSFGSYIPPSAGVLGSQYPMTNNCMHQDTLYFYFDSNASKVDFWGVAGNLLGNSVNHAQIYSNPQTIITFPSTYNTAFLDTANYDSKFGYNAMYNGYYVDSLREKERIITNSTVDGWGTVFTPTGNIACIRQHLVKNSVDSVWAKVVVGNFHYWLNISSASTSTPSYAYISQGYGPIVDIEYYTNTTNIYRITWNTIPLSTNSISAGNDLNVFPNPNNGEFDMTMNVANNNDYTIEISNVLGQVIYSETLKDFSGKYTKHLDLNTYGEGLYMVSVFDKTGLVKTTKISIAN